MPRYYWITPAIAMLALVSHGAAAEPALPNPEAAGPYPAGVTAMLLTDPAREGLVGSGPRRLMTEVWYPSTSVANGMPAPELWDYFLGIDPALIAGLMQMGFGADMRTAAENIALHAVRDAPVREGRWPLIIFSHGNGGLRSQALWWCEHMASHGYIVAAIDHTGNAGATVIAGQLIPMDAGLREASAEARPKDVSFVIDSFTAMDKGTDSRFYEKVDIESIGVAGHSFGGRTATDAASQDARVDAISPWAAVGQNRSDYDTPLMMLIATEDDTIGLEGNARMRAYYEESTGPKYCAEFVNAGHYSFTEMYRWNPAFGDGCGTGTRITNGEAIEYIGQETCWPLMNGYTTAFFGKHLKGIGAYGDYLQTNHHEEELIYQFAVDAVEEP